MTTIDNQRALTVSVAAYNVEGFLAEALESCIVPNADKLEVIVVNDGSTDGTLQIARGFERRMPGTFRVIDKPNGGYGSTMNASLAAASGRYFRYLDGDDWFDPSVLADYIDRLAECDCDCVITPYRRVYEDGSPAEERDSADYLAEGAHGVSELKRDTPLAACALAYKTDMLRNLGFHMSERCFYTDIEFAYLPMAGTKTVYVLHLPLYQYRIGREGQSVSVEGVRRHYKDIVLVCARLLNDLADVDSPASKYLASCLVKECCVVYKYLCISGPDEAVKTDLLAFDALVRKISPEIYAEMSKRSKRVKLLRKTGFRAWRLACAMTQKEA